MHTIYFNTHYGLVFSENAVAGEEAVSQGRAIAVEVPENISTWRLSLNLATRTVVIYGGVEKTEEQAIQQKIMNLMLQDLLIEKQALCY